MVRVVIALLMLLLVPSAAHAGKRIALLIGNKDYKPGVGALVNPLNDVRVVGEALKAVGFEVLKPVHNATRTTFLLATHEFAAKLKAAGPDAVGFLYYSGHGIASLGENYLIPIDVEAPSTQLLSVAGVKQSEVLAILRSEAPNAAHYLVLDACRNTLQGARGGKGFIPVGQQSGVLVAFAAEPGKTASDIGRGTGPYAAALAEELVKPGQNDLLMFHRVRVAVIQKTGGDQVPWTEDGIQRPERVLFGGENKPAPIQPQQLAVSEAAREWARVDKTSVAELETFVRRHGASPEADYARARIDSLKQQVAVATPPKAPQPEPSPKFGGPCGATATVAGGVAARVGNETLCLKPKDTFKDCPECPEMVVVPAGEFVMGSNDYDNEKPIHKVSIARPFALSRFEITFAEWDACISEGGCKHKPDDRDWGRGKRPVMNVSWTHIKQEYLPWLTSKIGRAYRLPTEAEWEYAARAGTRTRYSWGNDIGSERANCDGCRSPGSVKQTVPVSSYSANAFGLYNMHGNVWEWVEDCYHETYDGAPAEGSAWTTGACEKSHRVLRGGGWSHAPIDLRSANRIRLPAETYYSDDGFRVARTLE